MNTHFRNTSTVAVLVLLLIPAVASAENLSDTLPVIEAIKPREPIATDGKQKFVIYGKNFDNRATVTLCDLGTGEKFENRHVVRRSDDYLRLYVNFTSTPSKWSVEVKNPDGPPCDPVEFDVVAGDVRRADVLDEQSGEKGSGKTITHLGWVHPLGQEATITCRWFSGYNLSGHDATSSYLPGRIHLGADFRAKVDAPVYAIADGRVIHIYPSGDCVVVRHETEHGVFAAVYGHIVPSVVEGAVLGAGDDVGTIAPYGDGGHHLHFGIAWGGDIPKVDPGRAYGWGMMQVEYFEAHGVPNGFVDPIAWITTFAPKSAK